MGGAERAGAPSDLVGDPREAQTPLSALSALPPLQDRAGRALGVLLDGTPRASSERR